MTNQEAIIAERRASRERFIAANKLVLHHIVGNAGERIEQWDWPKKESGGRFDHYLLIQVFHDESWCVSLKADVLAPETDFAADLTKMLKALVAAMDGKAFIAK